MGVAVAQSPVNGCPFTHSNLASQLIHLLYYRSYNQLCNGDFIVLFDSLNKFQLCNTVCLGVIPTVLHNGLIFSLENV